MYLKSTGLYINIHFYVSPRPPLPLKTILDEIGLSYIPGIILELGDDDTAQYIVCTMIAPYAFTKIPFWQ